MGEKGRKEIREGGKSVRESNGAVPHGRPNTGVPLPFSP